MNTVLLIILSFFAVIGIMDTLVVILETVSVAKYKQIDNVKISVGLSGEIEDVEYLLNMLLIQANRIKYKNIDTSVEIKDMGLDESTYSSIYEFCLENDNIVVEK